MSRSLKLDTIFPSRLTVLPNHSSLHYDYDFTPSSHVYLWISGMKAFSTKLVRSPRKRWNDGGYHGTLDGITYEEFADLDLDVGKESMASSNVYAYTLHA